MKLHQKSMWKWRGNSLKFGLQRIDVISTSNRRRFDMDCPLGIFFLKDSFWILKPKGLLHARVVSIDKKEYGFAVLFL